MPALPTADRERALLAAGATLVIGCDEVGRGAIAGPVAVGVAVVDAAAGEPPRGLRDSKLLSEPRREELAPLVREWARASAVGLASADEVDGLGIIAALGLAGARALAALPVPLDGAVILLDGSHDWLSRAIPGGPRVVTQVKADRDCTVVAAASVIAKVHRDGLMIAAHGDAPEYGWAGNKGYASAAHYEVVDARGPHPLHRRSWLRQPALPGLEDN